MSAAARRRGRGRATAGDDTSQTTPRRGGPRQTPAGAFDGPASRGSASGTGTSQGRRPSNPPSVTSGPAQPPAGGFTPQAGQAGSRRSSVSGGQSQPGQARVPIVRGDPARDPQNAPRFTDHLRNVDLPASFFNIDQLYDMPTEFLKRPGFNSSGKAVQISLNSFPVLEYPKLKIFQYDVVIGNGDEKRIVQRKVWDSQERKSQTGPGMIYDGNKLAWSLSDIGEKRAMVDLDKEEGKPSRGDRNTFRLRIAKTKQLDISIIDAFLSGRIQMSVQVAEAISFLDHLLREGPSLNNNLVAVKRSFFARSGQKSDLGLGVEVYRGVYQSMRLAEGKRLVVNIDVANTCFWKPGSLLSTILIHMGVRDPGQLISRMQPDQSNGSRSTNPFTRTLQGRFKGTCLKAVYAGNKMPQKEYKFHKILPTTADDEKIDWKDPTTRKPTGEMLTITQYFQRQYNLKLQHPKLPLIEMTGKRAPKFPIELLQIKENQRYSTKLNDVQTANMIKFAVAPPSARLDAINQGKSWLNWERDTYLQKYGLKMGTELIRSNARILPPPGVKFGNRVEQPGTKGRWDLRGKTFLSPNPQELTAWGVGFFPGPGKLDKAGVEKFVSDFTRAYRGHGGKISNSPPHMMPLPSDPGAAVEQLHQQTGNKFQRRPQLLVFFVQDKNSFHYLRIKKSCDCRYGVVSQVMQIKQVQKGNPQYYSNVLMKVNAKLGGCTSQVMPHASSGFKTFSAPTMFIGADVSHASPGAPSPSMAAITVSFDRHAGRYAAACQTNGHRVEMITENNWRSMLQPLIKSWIPAVGGGRAPAQVYYMRDGVSEGQFAHVLNQEVPHIKAALSAESGGKWAGKITVVVASKRHHIRAFPKGSDAADAKGNPLPGCLIERDVTSPNEFDFFLYSHIALQGTSRPVHYTILYDDGKHPPNVIQNMIYEHCYQYMRSTTSVSLHPAVYYAHLASNRAKAHEDIEASQGPTGGPGFKANQPPSSDTPDTETKPLLEMFNTNHIREAMWYI